MLSVFAIAKNTFQESIRSRVLVVCLAVLLVLSFFTPMFPTLDNPFSRLKLALTLAMQLCFAFSLLILIFTSAAFIPDDIQSRRIYTILTKPVSRLQYLLGRLLGIALLTYCLMILFALIVMIYVRVTYVSMDLPGQQKSESFFSVASPYSIRSMTRYRQDKKVGEVPAHLIEIEIPKFNALDYDHRITLKALASFTQLNHADKIYLDFELIDQNTREVLAMVKDAEVLDKRFSTIEVPLSKSLASEANVLCRIAIAEKSKSYTSAILLKKENFILHRLPISFEFNVLKIFLVMAFQLSLLGFVALVASVRMSFYISALFAFTVFAAGSFQSFLRDYLTEKEMKLEYGAIDQTTLYYKISTLSEYYLQLICNIMPDFSRFDAAKNMIDGIALSSTTITELLIHFSYHYIAYFSIAVILFWRREV